jgi:hypothetical protein
MKTDIVLIALGLVTTITLAFASHDSTSRRVRATFWASLVATLGIIIVSGVSGIHASRELAAVQSDMISVRDYSAVARLDALGSPPGMGIGSDIKANSELINLLTDTYEVKGNSIFMKRTPAAEEQYETVINKYPKFPFGHYYLALCLRDKKDKSWRQHAERAVDILAITTAIDGHNTNHDEVLKKITAWLEDDKETEPEN